MFYWFLVNSTTGAIGTGSGTHVPDAGIASSGWELIGPYTTLDTEQQAIYAMPTQYLYQSGAFVIQAYWTATQSTTSGTTTITAILNNPPATPPTSATVTIGTTAISVPVTSGTATLPVTLHTTLSGYSVPVQVSASGTVSTTATVGTGNPPPVDVQAIAPTTSGDPYVIGPTGTGAKTFCRAAAMGLTPETEMEILTLSAQNLYLSTALGMQVLMTKIIPWAQQTTWSALSLTTEEGTALTALQTNLAKYFPGLSDLVTNSGDPAIPQVAEMYAQAPALQTAAQNYAQWLAELAL